MRENPEFSTHDIQDFFKEQYQEKIAQGKKIQNSSNKKKVC